MERMTFPPLRYALAIVRFPMVFTMGQHVAAFHDRIRDVYPQVDEETIQGITANMGPDGLRLETVAGKMWQFADPGRQHAAILAQDFLLLHSGRAYEGHNAFFDRLGKLLVVLAETPGIGVTHIHAVGFRMINLIEPRQGRKEGITAYMRPWALPTVAPEFEKDLEAQDSVYVSTFKTPHGALRFQALRRPGGDFPPDLNTSFVRANGWVEAIKADDYVFVDIDHFAHFGPLAPFAPALLHEKFQDMHGAVRKVFDTAVTPLALKTWNRKK